MFQYIDIKKYVIRKGHRRWTVYAKTLYQAKRKWAKQVGCLLKSFYTLTDEIYRA